MEIEPNLETQIFYNLSDALKNPSVVEILDLHFNDLSEFPMEILEFDNLKKLDIYNNQIASIPSEIQKLQKLEKLDISGNHLSELPCLLYTSDAADE